MTCSRISLFLNIFLEQEVIPPDQDGKGATVNIEHFLRSKYYDDYLFA